MSTDNQSKLNKLLQLQPPGVVLTAKWLSALGYSSELLRQYRKNNWLDSFGHGAMIRTNDSVDYLGAVCAMQQQLNLSIHPGAKTALALLGSSHFIEFNQNKVYLIGAQNEVLPAWFKNYTWEINIQYNSTTFLPFDLGLVTIDHKSFSLKIASSARALMECLFLAESSHSIVECYEVMKGLHNLSPAKVQALLEACTSIKVKRLFLFMSEKAGHAWFKYIDKTKVVLGNGNRSLADHGAYISKYKITVPKELSINEQSGL